MALRVFLKPGGHYPRQDPQQPQVYELFCLETFSIAANEVKTVDTGVTLALPLGRTANVIASWNDVHLSLGVSVQRLPPGFAGDIHVTLVHRSQESREIPAGTCIAFLVLDDDSFLAGVSSREQVMN